MDQEFKKEWLEALRSGEYKQGTKKLKQVDSEGNTTHCCLGVACELLVNKGILVESGDIDDIFFGKANEFNSAVLPGVAYKHIGIDENPLVEVTTNDHTRLVSVAELNDTGYSFNQIADLIEAQL